MFAPRDGKPTGQPFSLIKGATKTLTCSRCGSSQWITTMSFRYDPLVAAAGQFELIPTAPLLYCFNCKQSANDTITHLKKGKKDAQGDEAETSAPESQHPDSESGPGQILQ